MGTDSKRTFLAVILSGIVLFGWQYYFGPPPQETSFNSTELNPSSQRGSSLSSTSLPVPAVVAPEEVGVNEEMYSLRNGSHLYTLSNKLFINNIESEHSVFAFDKIVGSDHAFKISVIVNNKERDLLLTNIKQSENRITGSDTALGVNFSASLEENGKLNVVFNSENLYHYRYSFLTKPEELENQQVRQFLYFGTEVEHNVIGSSDVGSDSFKWFGLEFNYHLFAIVLPEKTPFKYVMKEAGDVLVDLANPTNTLNFSLVFTKKNYDHLIKLGDKLDLSLDFGIFGIIAVPILRGLQFIYEYVPNYGWAVILLTLIIRMLMFPLQIKSFKSMKQMQKVQPELAKLKEKFKDEPQKMQKETMALFKKAGANPLGGCLPLVAQMPVFFAFYQVLYNAVEFVNAPFIFWIVDLSVKDPFYVLPILMGAAMFAQTKLNPATTADPTQQKIMQFMPLIFCFIMKDLPAGLNLYIFVSTVFGIAQQLFVYRMTD